MNHQHKRHDGDYNYGNCVECGRRDYRARFKGRLLCPLCLRGDEEPLSIDNYIYQPSNMALTIERFGDKINWQYSDLKTALDLAMKKHGIRFDTIKEQLQRGVNQCKQDKRENN